MSESRSLDVVRNVYAAFGRGIFAGLGESLRVVGESYAALFTGSLGNPARMANALFYVAIYQRTGMT